MKLFKKNTSDKPSSAISGRMAVRDRFADISEKVDKKNPIIIECGASTGPMIEKYLSLFDICRYFISFSFQSNLAYF